MTPPTTTAGHDFGFGVVAVGDTLWVSVDTTSLDPEFANIYVYGNDNGNFILNHQIHYGTVVEMGRIMNSPRNEMRICTYVHLQTVVNGVIKYGTITVHDLVNGVWTRTFQAHSSYVGNKYGSEGGSCSNEIITVPDTYFTEESYSSTGRLYAYETPLAPTPPPQCTVTADCPANDDTYCRANACVPAANCTLHSDCTGEFNSGRLPFCDTKKGLCKDIRATTCTNAQRCTTEALKAAADGKSVGSVKSTMTAASGAVRSTAAASLITKLKASAATTVPSEMVVFVSAVETMTLDSALFTNNDEATSLASIAAVRCGAAKDECTVKLENSSRELSGENKHLRQLQASTYTVSITFDVSETAFALISNSTTLDDPNFAAGLAAAAGVSAADVVIQTTGGVLVITFTLTEESSGNVPIDNSVFDDIAAIQASLGALAEEVRIELGLNATDIENAEVDLCAGRDCGGYGAKLFDENNGICFCPAGLWGVNCDIPCTCDNGGACVMSYCV